MEIYHISSVNMSCLQISSSMPKLLKQLYNLSKIKQGIRQISKVKLHHLAASNTTAQFLKVIQNEIFFLLIFFCTESNIKIFII